MTDRELLQMALDALDSDNPDIQLRAAIHLRARLAQPEQEPVAYIDMHGQVYSPHELNGELRIKYMMKIENAPTPLYTQR